jgi:LPXTG-motif cell wall-anchored protein
MRATSPDAPTTWPRRLTSALAVVALVVGAVLLAARPAVAASEADYVGLGDWSYVYGRVGGSGSWNRYTAGEMMVSIDGGSVVVAYCIDLFTGISTTSGHDLPEVPWATSGIANLDQVSFVLNTYEPGSALLVGSDDEKAAGIQAAIWHLTDGFDLRTGTGSGNSADVVANYQAILASIPPGGLPPEPVPSLEITPATASADTGQLAGPFTVATTGTDLALVVPSGVEVVDWVTGLPITTVSDGDVFGVRSDSVGSVEVAASATATIHAGRVFARMSPTGVPEVQRLILGQTTTASTSDSVVVTFTEPTTTTSTTTTSTTTSTTTTTVPETTTTTVPETTTTTVPQTTTTVPQTSTTTALTTTTLGTEVLGEQLPRTGSDSTWLLWLGAAFAATGIVGLAADRRLRG